MKVTKLTYDVIDELEAVRRVLVRRYHEDISEEEFERLEEVAEYIYKALDLIL